MDGCDYGRWLMVGFMDGGWLVGIIVIRKEYAHAMGR